MESSLLSEIEIPDDAKYNLIFSFNSYQILHPVSVSLTKIEFNDNKIYKVFYDHIYDFKVSYYTNYFEAFYSYLRFLCRGLYLWGSSEYDL